YHALMAGVAVSAGVLTGLSAGQPSLRSATPSATALSAVAVVLAMRALWEDPARPWWSVGLLAAITLVAIALGLRERSQKGAYASTAVAMLTATCVGLRPWLDIGIPSTAQSL